MLLIGMIVYSLIGGMLVGALLTDKHTNTCKTDAIFCVIAGPIWPLAIGAASGFALVDNIKERMHARRKERGQYMLRFSAKLLKLQLISAETHYEVQRKINAR